MDIPAGARMVLRGLTGTAAALLGAAALTPPMAYATGSIGCHALDGSTARVALTRETSPAPAGLVVRREADGRRWSTVAGEEGERLGIAQAFVTEEWLAVDLVDEGATRRIASVRVLRVEEGRHAHQYGYLHLPGVAVHPLSCEGP